MAKMNLDRAKVVLKAFGYTDFMIKIMSNRQIIRAERHEFAKYNVKPEDYDRWVDMVKRGMNENTGQVQNLKQNFSMGG